MRRLSGNWSGVEPRRRIRIPVRQHNTHHKTLARRNFVEIDLQFLLIVDRELEILILLAELGKFVVHAIGRNVRQEERDRDEASLRLTVSFNDKHFTVPRHAVQHFAG